MIMARGARADTQRPVTLDCQPEDRRDSLRVRLGWPSPSHNHGDPGCRAPGPPAGHPSHGISKVGSPSLSSITNHDILRIYFDFSTIMMILHFLRFFLFFLHILHISPNKFTS
jgi:hypothetical protein